MGANSKTMTMTDVLYLNYCTGLRSPRRTFPKKKNVRVRVLAKLLQTRPRSSTVDTCLFHTVLEASAGEEKGGQYECDHRSRYVVVFSLT